MNKNCLKYLQEIKYLQVSLAEKIEIQNLCCATPDLINYQYSSSRKQIYVKKCNPAVYPNKKWLSSFAERIAVLSPSD